MLMKQARLAPPLNTFSRERLKAASWCSENIYPGKEYQRRAIWGYNILT